MPYETEYDKLKENIREWRASSGHIPSVMRILDAAEKTLNRMPQPVRGWLLVWPERHGSGKPKLKVSSYVYETEEAARQSRVDAVRWSCGDIKVVEVVCEYQPRREP